jgi:two-component system, OmpR family, sensor histidine kinase TctE
MLTLLSRLRPSSLRNALAAGIIVPLSIFVTLDAVSLHGRALAALNTAYDRTLLASTKSIGEFLAVEQGQLRVNMPYSAIEVFEAGASRLTYRVDGLNGELVAGDAGLPAYAGTLPARAAYPALVDFYDSTHNGQPVRVAALLQPVAGEGVLGVARIQVAETLEVRKGAAQALLIETLWRQGLLLLLLVIATVAAIHLALRPLVRLREQLEAPGGPHAGAVQVHDAPDELKPAIDALNRLALREHDAAQKQQRFVRDASHQLRTPFAVLKTQVQSALRGDLPAQTALTEIAGTVDRATRLANQLLALAKVGQAEALSDGAHTDVAAAARDVALDLAPLVAGKSLQFEFDAPEGEATPPLAHGHDWMYKEWVRNLLSNAIRHTPAGEALGVRVSEGLLEVWDHGPGIGDDMRERLFEPFATGDPTQGAGLGLAICAEIARSLQAPLETRPCREHATLPGLVVSLRWRVAAQ